MKETIKRPGGTYEVIKRYQLPDEYMKAHQLFFRNRITLRCIEHVDPARVGEVIDCAYTPETWRKEVGAC